MELNNHTKLNSVYFQNLIDASRGFALQITIDANDNVTVNQVEIKPEEEK